MSLHPIDSALQLLTEHNTPEERLAVIFSFYTQETSKVLAAPPTSRQRQDVYEWLLSMRGTVKAALLPDFIVSRPTRRHVAALSPRSKMSLLAQLPCNACEPVPDAVIQHWPIQVEPWSAQTDHARNTKLKAAVTDMLKEFSRGRLPTVGSPMCISVTSLVPRGSHRKDADNLLKGLLDSLATVIYGNDDQIQCLTSRRVEYAGDVGMYVVRAQEVYAWDADTVWDDPREPTVQSGRRVVI
ncbi:RusA family crossover junction endodeoxyribonuclease [Rhodococcus kroppenstedtii]|uniref:RusA family crossover junction endodeoxyribonuclease n=1 Tax=Rhodococcoides kroppenstedtii TaxID=293050 RepID=UPI001C9A340A|nr:RusA family crossover junction endodeoxyribonuclease [Rhodococcus kroppenstedtii]MBY6438113.1 RusA family crossover junction endodeoxyribonuclease [Rhodococcus kroppenstedtii]